MTELLEVPAIRQRVARLSVEEYHRLGELPVELLRGTIIKKMSKSPRHYSFVEKFRDILTGQIKPGWVLRQEGPLTFADSEPEPDLCVVRGKMADFYNQHPSTAEWATGCHRPSGRSVSHARSSSGSIDQSGSWSVT